MNHGKNLRCTLTAFFGLILLSPAFASGDEICDWNQAFNKCVTCTFGQSFFRDRRANCIACSGFCFRPSIITPEPGENGSRDQSKAKFTETSDAEVLAQLAPNVLTQKRTDALNAGSKQALEPLIPLKFINEIAVINPEVAGLMHTFETRRGLPIDLRQGSSHSETLTSSETVRLLTADASDESIMKSKIALGIGQGVRTEWRIVNDVNGRAVGIFSSHVVDEQDRVIRDAYPPIRAEFKTSPHTQLVAWRISE
jgi:hypothetical protein